MTKTKSFSFPTASCFQSGLFPLPHWELLCSGLPSTSPGPSKVMPSYSLPSRPHPAAAGRCRRVRTCVRSLAAPPSPHTLISHLAHPPAQMLPLRATSSRDPRTSHQHPPPRPAPPLCVSQALLFLSILRGLRWVCMWRIVPRTLQGGALS